jgi:hypothetical protein
MKAIEVFGVASTSPDEISFGQMEIAEQTEDGTATWILPILETPQVLDSVYLIGTTNDGKTTDKKELELPAGYTLGLALWPQAQQSVVAGTVSSVKGRILTLDVIQPVKSTLTITLATTARVSDEQAKPIPLTRIRQGIGIAATGQYTTENTFTASQIELTRIATSTATTSRSTR